MAMVARGVKGAVPVSQKRVQLGDQVILIGGEIAPF